MSWSDIRTATKLKLEDVTGIGKVYDYVILTDDWNYIKTNFADSDRIHVWFIGLGDNSENELVGDGDIIRHVYTIQIIGYYSLMTSSESSKTFEDLCMTIRNDFMKSFGYVKTYVPAYTAMAKCEPPSIQINNAVFVQQPVHRALINVQVTEEEANTLSCSG